MNFQTTLSIAEQKDIRRDCSNLKSAHSHSGRMKSSSSNTVLGIKRSVDLNMNSNIQKDEEKKPSEATKSRRSSKSSKTDNEPKGSERSENILTFTSDDDTSYEPGGNISYFNLMNLFLFNIEEEKWCFC